MRIILPNVFRNFIRIPVSTTTPSKTASLVGILLLSLALAVALLACEQAEPTPTPTIQLAPTATPTVPPRPTYTETPVPIGIPTPVPTGTPYPTYTPFPTFTPTSTYTATATITPTATPTSTATATVQPTVTSADSTQRSTSACSYPKLGVGLEWRVCDYEASLNGTDGRGAKSQPDLAVERIPVFIFPTEDVEPTGISEWIAERETGVRYVVPPYDVYSQWLVIWDAPISLLGPLSRRSDVAAIELVPQPLRDAQSSSNSGWVPTNAPFVHGAELWLNNTPAVDGDRVKVGIIDSGFDGILDLLSSRGIIGESCYLYISTTVNVRTS